MGSTSAKPSKRPRTNVTWPGQAALYCWHHSFQDIFLDLLSCEVSQQETLCALTRNARGHSIHASPMCVCCVLPNRHGLYTKCQPLHLPRRQRVSLMPGLTLIDSSALDSRLIDAFSFADAHLASVYPTICSLASTCSVLLDLESRWLSIWLANTTRLCRSAVPVYLCNSKLIRL